jgi:hypothetical protein
MEIAAMRVSIGLLSAEKKKPRRKAWQKNTLLRADMRPSASSSLSASDDQIRDFGLTASAAHGSDMVNLNGAFTKVKRFFAEIENRFDKNDEICKKACFFYKIR